MNNQQNNEEMEIDLLHILGLLWSRIWVIVISMVLCGAIALSISAFLIAPKYKSTAMMYVNNTNATAVNGSYSISTTEINAARGLAEIYLIILESRNTLEDVIEKTGLDYTYEQLKRMVDASAVNETEIFEITATSSDPAEAALIVGTILEVLPDKIMSVVDGSSVKVVDYAEFPIKKTSPSNTKNTAIGILIGLVLSAGVIVVFDLLDTTVRDEEFLVQKFGFPVLAVIPDANGSTRRGYGYGYSRYGRNDQYGYYRRQAEASDNEIEL